MERKNNTLNESDRWGVKLDKAIQYRYHPGNIYIYIYRKADLLGSISIQMEMDWFIKRTEHSMLIGKSFARFIWKLTVQFLNIHARASSAIGKFIAMDKRSAPPDYSIISNFWDLLLSVLAVYTVPGHLCPMPPLLDVVWPVFGCVCVSCACAMFMYVLAHLIFGYNAAWLCRTETVIQIIAGITFITQPSNPIRTSFYAAY